MAAKRKNPLYNIYFVIKGSVLLFLEVLSDILFNFLIVNKLSLDENCNIMKENYLEVFQKLYFTIF